MSVNVARGRVIASKTVSVSLPTAFPIVHHQP
jgi:hypothetical protein